MQQRAVETYDDGLLSAVLCSRAREHTSHFTVERTAHPQRAGLIEQIAHLCRHIAVARGHAEDDAVGFGELIHFDLRHVRESLPRLLPHRSSVPFLTLLHKTQTALRNASCGPTGTIPLGFKWR